MNNSYGLSPVNTIDVEHEVLDNTPWYKRINMPRISKGGVIGSTGGAIGAYLATKDSDNGLVTTGATVGGGLLGSALLGTKARNVAIPLAVIGGVGYGGYHVATADDRARAKLEQEQLDNFNSILQAQKDREMVNEYIKQQKLKEQYETEKQWVLLNQLGNAVNNIPTLPYDVNNYLYTEQLMTPSY